MVLSGFRAALSRAMPDPAAALHRLQPGDLRAGEPLPFDLHDGAGRLLLQAGALIADEAQLEQMIGRGLHCDAERFAALLNRALSRETSPSPPYRFRRLDELMGRLDEIVALVRLDPGIAARVLQLANSAYYGQGALRCATVEQAVNRVGYGQVFELVSFAVASQVLVRPLDVYGVEADELWRLSVAGALAAELLAEVTLQDRNIAYTAGLLHCVGMVAIDEWALRRGAKLRLVSRGLPREATEHERQELGFTQAEVGAALLRHWDFPRAMSEPVRWQYTPRASAGFVRMASLLHAGKWVLSAVCAPVATLPPHPSTDAKGLTED
jgi:HD-like signal output (HDOD) protein